jgi:cytochrome c553
MRIRAFTLGLALACTGLAAHADGDAAKGKVESYTCIGCHGIPNYTNNYPTYRVPKLAGQHAAYIVQALKEYKAGDRAHNTMHAQASSLSDQQMQDIAAYFESLGKAQAPQQ